MFSDMAMAVREATRRARETGTMRYITSRWFKDSNTYTFNVWDEDAVRDYVQNDPDSRIIVGIPPRVWAR